MKETEWREETAKVNKHLIEADILEDIGEIRLANFDKFILKTHLNKVAKMRARDTLLQIRSYIKSIFAETVNQGFLTTDPARKLKTPANLQERDKIVLTREQLAEALARLKLRAN